MRKDLETAFKAAKNLKNWRLMPMPTLEEIEALLDDDEEVRQVVKANFNQKYVGVAVLTDRKMHFLGRGTFKSLSAYSETFQLSKVTGISRERDLYNSGWKITVTRASNVDKLLGVEKEDSEKFARAANSIVDDLQGSRSQKNENKKPDPIDQLKRLKGLLDTGVLTQTEFDEKKKTLMDKI